MKVYLDNAATTPMAPEVLEAMLPFFQIHFGNPSSTHSLGRETRAAIEQARKSVAGHLNSSPGEILFTSGGTESTNIALISAVRDLRVKRIITSEIEHYCVLNTVKWLRDNYEIELVLLPIDINGRIALSDLNELLHSDNVLSLVSIMHANNEIGVLNDIQQIGEICRLNNAYFHSDTVQTMAHYAFDATSLNIHFLTGSAHKFHGPKGVGFLYIRKGLDIRPMIYGGGQERGKRAGTENVYGIVGLAKAMDMAYAAIEEDMNYVQGLKTYMLDLLKSYFGDIRVNGAEEPSASLYTVLNVSFPPSTKGPLLLFELDMAGVCASGGSACNSGASTGSHVISALKGDPDRISIRFSFSRYNTRGD